VPVYGLSEAALAVTFAPPGRPLAGLRLDAAALARSGMVAPGEREVMSVGTPIPGVAIEVRADREADEATAGDPGATLGPGQLGRIWVRGPSLFREYLGDPAATARALRDGWLDTGDLGFVQGGELFVHGRAKDLVIVRGANHAPEEFEEALHGLPGLRPGGAVAVGGADAAGGERLVILAERTRRPASPGAAPGPAEPDDDSGLQAQIRRALLERTGVEPGLVRLLAPGTLPRTSSGKLRRGEARRRLEAEALDAPAPVNAWRLALALLRGQLARWRARWLGRSAPAEVAQPR
jgi:acyl-CoA synthetase (AMP-forming)/AMP-acid ligase II